MKWSKARAVVPAWARWLATLALLAVGLVVQLPGGQRPTVENKVKQPAPAGIDYKALDPPAGPRARLAALRPDDGDARERHPPRAGAAAGHHRHATPPPLRRALTVAWACLEPGPAPVRGLRPMRSPRLMVGLLLATGGCAGQFRFGACPAEGGRPWQEVSSAHFRVRTDLPEADAHKTALHLERTRTAPIAVAWPRAPVPGSSPMQVVVLRDGEDFRSLFGEKVGAFVASNVSGEPLMVLAGLPSQWTLHHSSFEASESTLNHELAHQLGALLRLRQPRWLSEGIACLLETVEISEDGATATVGAPNLSRHGVFMQRRFGTRDVLTWKMQDPDDTGRLYATAWLLVYWLYNTRPADLSRYQDRLLQGMDEHAAWRLSFRGLQLDDLDRQLFTYASEGQFRTFQVPIRLGDPRITVAPLSDAAVHATRARLGLLANHFDNRSVSQPIARAELDEALRVDPNNLDALLTAEAQSGSPAEQITLLRRATAAHPGSGRAWLALAGLLTEAGAASELESSYRKALAALPDSDLAMNNLAWFYVKQRRFEEALPLSQGALALDPVSPAALDTHAHVLEGLGRCAEAITFQRRALSALAGIEPAKRPEYHKYLRELEQRCGVK